MNLITGIDKLTAVFEGVHLSEFRILRELHFYESNERFDREQSVDIVLESENKSPNLQIKFHFGGVSGLRIDNVGGGETRIIGFDVKNISSRQLEGIAWEVLDFENDSIKLHAKTAEVVSVVKL